MRLRPLLVCRTLISSQRGKPVLGYLPATTSPRTPTTHLNMSTKPTIPADYVVPTVWQYDATTMQPLHGSNVPTAGAQSTVPRPSGRHDIQLYGLATPNGMKASILLEELVEKIDNFEYDAFYVDIGRGDQFTSGHVEVNPNSKIPALYDQSNGARVFESGAILIYLAEKYQAFLPTDPVAKAECMSWVFFQTGAGPFYGGGGLTHFLNRAPMQWQYAIDRYTIETKRILDVLNQQLADKNYLCGDEYSIADIMHWGWTKSLIAMDYLDGQSYQNLNAWVDRIAQRPAVQKGVRVLGFGPDAVKERHSKADVP
jgi:GSH-dependent disulfide-bond oxidoreductase